METIFISYRRSDTEGYAGRLADSLTSYFGAGRVFRDVGGIAPGEDFSDKISETIAGAGAVVVLIGPNWLTEEVDGKSRLYDPDDHLAAEIEAAMGHSPLVVPVLVQNARMPRDEDLPEPLRRLVRLNAVSLADETWASDVTRLAKVLAMDVAGSVAERRIGRLRIGTLSLLAGAMLLILAMFGAELHPSKAVLSVAGFCVLVSIVAVGVTRVWFHPSVRHFVWGVLLVGILGGTATYAHYLYTEPPGGLEPQEELALDQRRGHAAAAETGAIIMLIVLLLSMSGFKPNDRLD